MIASVGPTLQVFQPTMVVGGIAAAASGRGDEAPGSVGTDTPRAGERSAECVRGSRNEAPASAGGGEIPTSIQDAEGLRIAHRVHSVADACLAVDVLEMEPHTLFGDSEAIRDLPVPAPLANLHEHFHLPR